MKAETKSYNKKLSAADREISDRLATTIDSELTSAENKVWHAHPVWFLEGNPVAGYQKLKDGIRLMFWSGADFGDDQLKPGTGKFKDASIRYTSADQINVADLQRWLRQSMEIQWDYKNVVKRKGKLERLK